MSITPREPADFTPSRGNFTELKPFRFWCQKVLPLVYDDSLSYYELLCKVVDFLNKTMEDVETLEGDVNSIYEAYEQLQSYVNDYFSTLDVQTEINNKLDSMAESGALNQIIEPFIPDLVSEWLEENLSPTTPPIDKTLTLDNACANSKTVGDKFKTDEKTIYNISDAFTGSETIISTLENGIVLSNGTIAFESDPVIKHLLIPVEYGDIINYVTRSYGTAYPLLGFYDGENYFNYVMPVSPDTITSDSIIVPYGATYMFLNVHTSYQYSATRKTYSIPEIDKTLTNANESADAQVTGKYLFSNNENIHLINGAFEDSIEITYSIENGIVLSNGTIAFESDSVIKHLLIPVEYGHVINYTTRSYGTAYPLLGFYDGTNYYDYKMPDVADTIHEGYIEVPYGATHMFLNIHLSYPYGVSEKIFSLENYALKPIITDEHNVTKERGLLVFTSIGSAPNLVLTNVSYFEHGIVPYDSTKNVVVQASKFSGAGYSKIIYLDANGLITGSVDLPQETGLVNYEITDVPSGTTQIVCNYDTVTAPKYFYTEKVSIEEYVANEISKKVNFKNKKIVWFGTSVSASGYIGSTNPDAYPQRIGEILDCTVFNESVGSSPIHCKLNTYVSETNPYGFYGNFEKVSRCLTNNLAEMNWIIDHYNSGVFTSNVPSSISSELAEQIRNCSYERKLDKYLTEESFPDLFVFDHGVNDTWVTMASQITLYEQIGGDNLYTFRGGMNFLIKRILDYNPSAKILIIGMYTNSQLVQFRDIPTVQDAVAKDWEVPICKMWENLGWTTNHTLNVHGHWVLSNGVYTWTETSETYELTPFDCFVPDRLHPHLDSSQKGIIQIANLLANFINNL